MSQKLQLIVFFVAMGFGCSVISAAPLPWGGAIQNISNTPGLDDVDGYYYNLDVNNSGHVAWAGDDGNDYEVYFYNGSTVANVSNHDGVDDGINYWGGIDLNNPGHVIWADTSESVSGASAGDIWYWNGTSTTKLCDDYQLEQARLNDSGQASWDGPQANWPEVYYWNGTSYSKITTGIGGWTHNSSHINEAGDIVWHSNNSSWDIEVRYWDRSENDILNLSNAGSGQQHTGPVINDNGHVAWEGRPEGTPMLPGEIYYWDGVSKVNISNSPTVNDRLAKINNLGHVAWYGHDGSDWEVYFYDGLSSSKISNRPDDDTWCSINNSDQVVWHGSDGNDFEIFLWKNGVVYQITDNDWDDRWPQISDSGHIAWTGDSGTGGAGEVYLTRVPEPGTLLLLVAAALGLLAYKCRTRRR